uniref:Uncharacterized protein n=1 Tax=Tanacetum cinerariifolium TaxID=118510 RepID=A0A6L2KDY9_TANCI|nr:hypothetical protein [Tanacetum cinerariifolium]
MDQDSAHVVTASKVSMLKPSEYEIWRMRIEQYIQMIDYALWEVIENSVTLPKTNVVEGVITEMPITTAEEKAQRRLEVEEGPTYALMDFSSSSSCSEIVENCKKGLGYKNYNAVPPPYTGNFMPPTPNLSFTGLDEFVNKLVVKNCKAMSSKEEPKAVRKNDDALIIEEWVLDDEEENVSQPKIEKKTVRPSIVKKEFVKSKQQEETARKTVKQVEHNRQNTHSPRGNQRNCNNMISQKL